MTAQGYYLSPRTGARFYIAQHSEWGKKLLADGWTWIDA